MGNGGCCRTAITSENDKLVLGHINLHEWIARLAGDSLDRYSRLLYCAIHRRLYCTVKEDNAGPAVRCPPKDSVEQERAWRNAVLDNLAVLDVKGAPRVAKKTYLNIDDRIKICEAVPSSDWEKFAGQRHVAVSVSRHRIVDADNDLTELQERVGATAHQDDQFFIAPGKPTRPRTSKRRAR